MDRNASHLGASTAELLKLAAFAVVLALVVSSARTAIAPLVADRPPDRTAGDLYATQLAYRYAASYVTTPEATPEEPL